MTEEKALVASLAVRKMRKFCEGERIGLLRETLRSTDKIHPPAVKNFFLIKKAILGEVT